MKKSPYKLMTILTSLTIMIANVVAPISTFASEEKQAGVESIQSVNLTPNEASTRQVLDQVEIFAKSMDRYVCELMRNPDIHFAGIQLEENESLPDTIKKDQTEAKKNALYWEGTLKPMLRNTLMNLTAYNTIFQIYYDDLVDAANKGNGAMLVTYLTDLQADIQEKQKESGQLKTAVMDFKDKISADYRRFEADRIILENLFNKYHGLEKDETILQQMEGKVKQISKIQKAIDDAIQATIFVYEFWDGLDRQYKSVVQYLKKSYGKISDGDMNSLLKQLKVSKDIWGKLALQAEILQEGMKKIEWESVFGVKLKKAETGIDKSFKMNEGEYKY
ncbi:hypothetical protein BM86_34680 [Bacillus thuringiensis]|nr:hypothetical protein [Bacillus thuringiensis]